MTEPVQSDEARVAGILGFANKHKLNAQQLEKLINSPVMNKENVLLYMMACTPEELALLFYQTGLVKLTEMVDRNQKLQLKAQHEQLQQSAPPGGPSEAVPDSK